MAILWRRRTDKYLENENNAMARAGRRLRVSDLKAIKRDALFEEHPSMRKTGSAR